MMVQKSINPKFDPPTRFPVKKIGYFSNSLAICCVDFPIYYVESISERHLVIAGGGGSSKTGVHNQINVLELVPTQDSCATELVTKYQTPKDIPDAIMTGALIRDSPVSDVRLVTGAGNGAIVIYNLNFDLVRRSYVVNSHKIYPHPSLKSEFKSIKYISNDRLLSGSIDGHLVVWNLKKDTEVESSSKVHQKEIDEIDYNPITKQIVTLSRGECRYVIRNLSSDTTQEFKKDVITQKSQASNVTTNYIYRSCRFAYDSINESGESWLLVACNPVTSKGSSLIYKWSTKDDEYKILACRPVTMDGIMAMNVSKDGLHFAIGTRSGGVAVFGVKAMREIYRVDNAHHNAVTGLEFLPPKQETLTLTNSKQYPVLSVSIDRQLVLHRHPQNSVLLKISKMLFLAMILIIAFVFMHRYYLEGDLFHEKNDTLLTTTNDSMTKSTIDKIV